MCRTERSELTDSCPKDKYKCELQTIQIQKKITERLEIH